MVFNSFEFIFLFLPITLIGYFTLNKFNKHSLSKIWLILCSFYFYGYFNPSYLLIMIFSILVNFIIAKYMNKNKSLSFLNKMLLFLGITFNLVLLGYFKYYDFFINNINHMFKTNLTLLNIVLPLGISFFTFQQLSFIIDSYHQKNLKYDFLSYCLFVTFFPQLVAGPIVLPQEMLPQFEDNNKKQVNYENLNRGLYLLAIGLVKKAYLADTISTFANAGYSLDSLSFMDAWITSISYSLQLYLDFSGYCDIALGVALMFNITLPINFNSPYHSTNIKEFWKRWHITLGRFLTSYIYIPLGGSRKGKIITLTNLFIVFLISGIWHGAGWTFIVWGGLHGLAIVIHRIWYYSGRKLPKYLGIMLTLFTVNLFWVFFRAESIPSALTVIKAMLNITTLNQGITDSFFIAATPNLTMKIALLISVMIVFLFPNSNKKVNNMKFNIFNSIEIISFLIIGILSVSSNLNSTFLYFNF